MLSISIPVLFVAKQNLYAVFYPLPFALVEIVKMNPSNCPLTS